MSPAQGNLLCGGQLARVILSICHWRLRIQLVAALGWALVGTSRPERARGAGQEAREDLHLARLW